MPHVIELVSVGEDVSLDLESSARRINDAQEEFIFRLPPRRLRQYGLTLAPKVFTTAGVVGFLIRYLEEANAGRQYVIGCGNRPLNHIAEPDVPGDVDAHEIYGCSEPDRGVAFFTLTEQAKYTKSRSAYISYFLLRYALGFLIPDQNTHVDGRACIFDRKGLKKHIVDWIETGEICRECKEKLAPVATPELETAITNVHELVRLDESGRQHLRSPSVLVMRGGGARGLALLGACQVLKESGLAFDTFVGTSAGAITAGLLASGLSIDQLQEALFETNFRRFLDSWFPKLNFILRGWLYPGDYFVNWFNRLLHRATRKKLLTMQELRHRAIIFAAGPDLGLITFDSNGGYSHTSSVAGSRPGIERYSRGGRIGPRSRS